MSYNKEFSMYEGYIYCIANKLDGKQYIGQTTRSVHRRWKEHINDSKDLINNPYVLYKAMNKHGLNNFTIKTLIKIRNISFNNLCSELNYYEEFYIDKYKTLCPKGYNLSKGGDNHYNINVLKPVYQFNINGEYINYFNSISEASSITGIDGSNIVKVCRKKARSTGNFIWSYSNNINIDDYKRRNTLCKPVCQYNLNGELINTYNSLKEAEISTNAKVPNIIEVCNGNKFSVKGFVWRYKEDDFYKYKTSKNYPTKPINQLNINGVFIRSFNSIKEASTCLNISASSLSSVCKGKSNTAGGYRWEYSDNITN